MKKWHFELKNEKFYIDGKETMLLCGEIHYFRIPRRHWEQVLDALVESGCNAVAYYVPWFVHEYQEGKFDFHGTIHPDNDLHTWIRLTMERGLLAYFRPGPYIYAETTDLGIPRWLTEKYPDILVQRYENGKYIPTDFANSVSHNHPVFLKAVKRWYKNVIEEIREYQYPKGNIVFFQLCNEIPGDDHDDENPKTHGIGHRDGMFPEYLERKYGTVEKIREVYGTGFDQLEKIHPWQLRQANASRYQEDHLEYYYGTYFPEYFRRLKQMAEEEGIQVPFVHNAYNPRAISLHYQNKEQNAWLQVGVDCYYSLNGKLGMKEATYYCEFGAEYLKRYLKNVPWVMEQECGYWNDYPEVYGPELYIWNIWTLACGYCGMNMYLFAGGINRRGMGFYGTEHNWQAPVKWNGEKSETYVYIKKSIEDARKYEKELQAELQYDLALGIPHGPGLIWKDISKVCSNTYFALKSAGFTPELYDYESMTAEQMKEKKCIFIVSDQIMDIRVQSCLAEYVQQGGILILTGRVPVLDENQNPCRILAEALSIHAVPCLFEEDTQGKLIYKDREYFIGTNIQKVYGETEILADSPSGEAAVLKARYGKGRALILPFAIELIFRGMAEFLQDLLSCEQILPTVKGAFRIRAIPKADGNYILLNLHPVEVREKIQILKNGSYEEYEAQLKPYSFQIQKI